MKKSNIFTTILTSIIFGGATAFGCFYLLNNNQDRGNNELFLPSITSKANYQTNLIYAAEKGVEGVVSITKKEIVAQQNNYNYYNPLYDFFGIPRQQNSQREIVSGGSGVIISKDGYIITNNHVISKASSLKVTLPTGESYSAELIGTDPTTDIALIKIDADNLPAIAFGKSEDLKLGQTVLAIGNPLGLNSTVTAGIISALGRKLDVIPSDYRIESFIQTDAAVNPGNSGGALVNTDGELIGINTVIKSPTGSYAGYSFAVPSSIAKKVTDDLKEFGSVKRAMLGLGYSEINADFIERSGTNISEIGGLYIGIVEKYGAAYKAGIREGDILLSINGVKTNSSTQLQEIIAQLRPNDKAILNIVRGGKEYEAEVILEGIN